MARRKSPLPSHTRRHDWLEEHEARIKEMMERAQEHQQRAEHHREQADQFMERAEALKRNPPPNRTRT